MKDIRKVGDNLIGSFSNDAHRICQLMLMAFKLGVNWVYVDFSVWLIWLIGFDEFNRWVWFWF